ncbi:ATP-dependent sacrificial sulfur transferase LarE [Paractinoplanes ovalisporus]|uniref:ATP-dependent sacrificial sulfur transferase LarE n=1 Tax=Paractinoplanes ovalisporus TaxID=2810368 RepID=UPI0027DC5BBE|nr:ATP-dependent sacrificial sulfur transferase LarE [Actinoplanes ovalisporus]
MTDLARATDLVAARLRGVERLGVAFSGGVDSSVLLALAARALGAGRVLAILGVSPSLAADERAAAHGVARHIGVPVVEIETDEGSREAYRANGPDRCFHCKDELFTRIGAEIVSAYGLDAVAYGENADDVRRHDRPGARAAAAHHVLAPLADAGLDKLSVRRVARALALPCADKPAAPCLASRIPHYEIVSPRKLSQVEQAEAALRRLGFDDLRVRHHGDIARVELSADDLVRAVTSPTREQIHEAVTGAGFRFVTVDLAGIQSGAFTGAYTASSGSSLATPSTNEQLATPSTNEQLAAPSGNGQLAAPSGNGQLAAPSGNGQLAAPSGNGQLAAPSARGQATAAERGTGLCASCATASAELGTGR